MEMRKIAGFSLVSLVVIGLAYGSWLLKRKVNYSFEYQNQVEQTIKDKTDAKFIELEKRIKELEEQKISGWGND